MVVARRRSFHELDAEEKSWTAGSPWEINVIWPAKARLPAPPCSRFAAWRMRIQHSLRHRKISPTGMVAPSPSRLQVLPIWTAQQPTALETPAAPEARG